MTDISNNIHSDRSTVTTLVNKLIKLRYGSSKKDANDSKSKIIFSSKTGKVLEPNFEKIS